MANVLIADDEATIRRLLSSIIKKLGHTPIEAANGKEAFDKYKNESIDLSFIDIQMPEIDGIDCLERVKQIDPNAVVIIMTGYPSAETIIDMINDEGYTYLAKPLNVNKVMDLVQRGLEYRKARLKGEDI